MTRAVILLICIIIAVFVLFNSRTKIDIPNETPSCKQLRDPVKLQRVNDEWGKISTGNNKSTKIKWRDEETDRDIANIQLIPNRYGDLPDVSHLRPVYNPNSAKIKNMANDVEADLSDLVRDNKTVADISMIPNRITIHD